MAEPSDQFDACGIRFSFDELAMISYFLMAAQSSAAAVLQGLGDLIVSCRAPRIYCRSFTIASHRFARCGQTAVASVISWIILLISARQEPQFVPACVASPTAATVRQPRATTAEISLAPVPKQAQTVAP